MAEKEIRITGIELLPPNEDDDSSEIEIFYVPDQDQTLIKGHTYRLVFDLNGNVSFKEEK